MELPRKIMQTWKTRDVPDRWKSSPRSIKRHMPEWQYTLMTDEDNRAFVERHFPTFLPYYDAFPYPIQRADAIRYCYLYVHGGLYMDLDMEVQHDLEDLFLGAPVPDCCGAPPPKKKSQRGHRRLANKDDTGLYLVESGNISSYLTNAFMASRPGHPLWLDMIEHMKKSPPWWAVGKHLHVMYSTGPCALSRVVSQNNHAYTALPSRLVTPCSVCNLTCASDDAYVKPLPGSSWVGLDGKIYILLFCHWKTLLSLLFIFFVLCVAAKLFLSRLQRSFYS